ncbi:MAG: ABC transporter permease [Candidatus Cloacimonetes bacterium]|nr:ABC transporter permease [Candidatus Cloacimonadota bacterium]
MGANDISIFSIGFLLLLLLPIFYIGYKLKLRFNKRVIISVARMILQLAFVGFYLQYLFKFNNSWLNFAYLLIMIAVASFSVLHSANFKIVKFIIPIFISILIPQVLMILFFNKFVANIDNIFNAKYLVPIGGMLLGNCLKGNIIALNNFWDNIRENEKIYMYDLALGANRYQALKPFVTKSILAATNPTIASIATIGLVSLPGMMTGQILGGSVPLVAIKYQIAIMIAIFIAQFFSVLLSIFFSTKLGFDGFDMIKSSLFKTVKKKKNKKVLTTS